MALEDLSANSELRNALTQYTFKNQRKLGLSLTDAPTIMEPQTLQESFDELLKKYGLGHGAVAIDLGLLDKAMQHANAALDDATVLAGRVAMDYGDPGKGLTLRLRERSFGGATRFVGESRVTDDDGFFNFKVPPKPGSTYEIVAEGKDGQQATLGSPIRHTDATPTEVALIAAAWLSPPATEFARLLASIESKRGADVDLALAKEDPVTPGLGDLSLLAADTGWDVRVMALAAGAKKNAAATGLSFEASYALARTGLRTDADALAIVSAQTVRASLESANTAGIVRLDEDAIKKALGLQRQIAKDKLDKLPLNAAGVTLGDFISMAAGNDHDATQFRDVLFDYAVQPAEGKTLWQVAKDQGVNPKTLQRLEWQEPLALLTGANVALMKSLISSMDPSKDLAQLVTDKGLMTRGAWEAHIRQLAGASVEALERLVPQAADFGGLDARVAAYSEHLARELRSSFPTESLLRRVGAMGPDALGISVAERAKIVDVLTGEGVRIGSRGITALAEGLESPSRRVVERLHRMYQVTPDDETFDLVWQQSAFDSAFDIASVPCDEWVAHVGSQVQDPALIARLVATHTKATQVTEVTQNLYGLVPAALAAPATAVSRSAAPATPGDAQALKQRFPVLGSMIGEMPACEHCRSVLSPAAYFVDLLRLLDRSDADWGVFKSDYQERHRIAYPSGKPFEVLDARRPDLADLALTCANTHTALPYIDIVNELLEGLVPPIQPGTGGVGEDETYSTEELVAEPRRMRTEAYEALAGQFHPPVLPLDLPWEQGRALAPLLGLQPSELVETLRPNGFELRVAAERLGLSPAELRLFVDPKQLDTWFRWYGLKDANEQPLRNAATLARRLGLTPLELTDVVRSQFVNPQLQSQVVLLKLGVSLSDVLRDKTKTPPFSDAEQAEFDRRLVLLDQRFASRKFKSRDAINKLLDGGKLKETLVLSETVSGGTFDTLQLRRAGGADDVIGKRIWLRLVQFVRLMRRLGVSVAQADSLLCALHPGGAALGADDGWAPRMTALIIQLDRMQQLKALLKSSDDDFFLPVLWSELPTAGISPLYAALFLRDASHGLFDDPAGAYLSAPDLQLHKQLPVIVASLGIDEASIKLLFPNPAERLTVAAVSVLYRHARLAKALGLRVAELREWSELLGLNPCRQPDQTTDGVLEASSRTLRFVDAVRRFRGRQVSLARLRAWMEVPPPALQPRAILQRLQAELKSQGDPRQALIDRLASLLGIGRASVPEALVDQIVADLQNATIDWVHGTFPCEAGLRQLSVAADVANAMRLAPEKAGLPECKRLAVIADVAKALALGTDEIAAAMLSRGVFGDDAKSGILATYTDTRDQPSGWLELLAFSEACQPAKPGASKWHLLIAAANQTAGQPGLVTKAVSEFTDCQEDDVKAAATALRLSNADLVTWRGLYRLVSWLQLAKRVGQTPAALAEWDALSSGAGTFASRVALAGRVRDAAKARYSARGWLTAVRGGADRLRQRRRDALLAYVVRQQDLTSDDEVYEKYLIDTRMEPVVLTSRLRMAIASVQLFVQRCLLNQEAPQVSPSAIRSDEWEWMKRYRVWEANRKIFLYPENWLDPEFRDDRSPLFRRLERHLLQTEINNDEAESALFEYARDLEAIANLDIIAMTCEQPAGNPGRNTVHVIGRTHAAPHKYFHRRNSHGWTPWEPLDADIQGDHVVAAFWKQRLHVFWLTFSDSASQNRLPKDGLTVNSTVTLSTKRMRQVRLAWADCIRGEWHTHLAAGMPLSFEVDLMDDKPVPTPQEQVFVSVSIERDVEGNDGALRVHVCTVGGNQAFRVVSHNAPVITESPSVAGKLDLSEKTDLLGLRPVLGRYKVDATELKTAFYSLKEQVERQDANGRVVENPKADAGPGRLVMVPTDGDMRVTLLDAPLHIAGDWARRLSPFFFSDTSGSYYVEVSRSSKIEKVTEKWLDIDWKKYFKDYERPPINPIFPGPIDPIDPRGPVGPRPGPYDGPPIFPGPIGPIGPINPVNPRVPIGPRPGPDSGPPNWLDVDRQQRDWLLDPQTVVRYDGLTIGKSGVKSIQR